MSAKETTEFRGRNEAELRQMRKGQAIPAQSIVPPLTSGYDPAFRSEMSLQDLHRL